MRRLIGLIVPMTLVLALGACGDDSSKQQQVPTQPLERSEITDLIQKGRTAKAKVTYETSDGNVVTIAQDPPKRAFTQGESSIYQDGSEGAVICSKFGASDVSCISVERLGGLATFAGAGSLGTVAQILQQENLPEVTPLEGRAIAGRDAACAGYSLPLTGSGRVEICVDTKTGVPLSLQSVNSIRGNFDLVATKVEEPKSSDFNPPSTPRDLNEFLPTTSTT